MIGRRESIDWYNYEVCLYTCPKVSRLHASFTWESRDQRERNISTQLFAHKFSDQSKYRGTRYHALKHKRCNRKWILQSSPAGTPEEIERLVKKRCWTRQDGWHAKRGIYSELRARQASTAKPTLEQDELANVSSGGRDATG